MPDNVRFSDTHRIAIRATGVNVNVRPDGVIEIYVSETRNEWKAHKIGHGYEVIVIVPRSGETTVRDTVPLSGGELAGGEYG